MGRPVLKAMAATLCLSAWATNLVYAQGMAEMGAVYATPKGQPPAGYAAAVGKLYGAGAAAADKAAIDANDGEIPTTGPTAYRHYARKANDAYTQAVAAEKAGKINEAQKLYYQALSVRQNVWGVSDPGCLTILLKLGDLNVKQKHYDYAETCYKQYLGGLAKKGGPGSYESAFALSKLATLYELKGQQDEAVHMIKNIMALQERKFGVESKEYRVTRMNYIDALIKDKEFTEGQDVSKDAMAAETAKSNEKSQEFLHLLTCYATCARGLNHEDDAKQAEARAESIRKDMGTPAATAAPPADDKMATTTTNASASDAGKETKAETAPAHSEATGKDSTKAEAK